MDGLRRSALSELGWLEAFAVQRCRKRAAARKQAGGGSLGGEALLSARAGDSHDRIRDGAIQRLEVNIIMAHDIQQVCLDRRVTELTGNCRSLIE